MTDLSVPPLSLEPLPGEGPGARTAPDADTPRREPFAWPTPSLTSYPVPTCPIEPEPC